MKDERDLLEEIEVNQEVGNTLTLSSEDGKVVLVIVDKKGVFVESLGPLDLWVDFGIESYT